MAKKKFEVGKKYVYTRNQYETREWECVWVDEEQAVLKTEEYIPRTSRVILLRHYALQENNLEEVHIPVVKECYTNVYYYPENPKPFVTGSTCKYLPDAKEGAKGDRSYVKTIRLFSVDDGPLQVELL